jgi:hypothetical protein
MRFIGFLLLFFDARFGRHRVPIFLRFQVSWLAAGVNGGCDRLRGSSARKPLTQRDV